jgi:hypothetical protein
MKKIVLSMLVVTAFATANAQVNIMVKGGITVANVTGRDAEGTKSLAGFNGGIQAAVKLVPSFYIKPELSFSAQGAKVPVEIQGDGGQATTMEGKTHLNYLNLPLQVEYMRNRFFVEAGPKLGYLLSAKLKGVGETADLKEDFKKIDFGAVVGAGYVSKWNIGISARYEHGFSSIAKQYEGETDAKVHNSVFSLGLFYVLR